MTALKHWRIITVLVVGIMALPPAHSVIADTAAGDAAWQPNKPIIITAPSNPGSGWDAMARFMQMVIGKDSLAPQPVEVINRGGGSGSIAMTELVAAKNGDPHELMAVGFHLTSAALMLGSRYSLLDTTPLARLIGEYQIVAVPVASPFRSLNDLITAYRADPKSVSWGGGAAGGTDHIFMALLSEQIGVDPAGAKYVAFTGGGETAAAVMGGQVSAAISGYGEFRGLLDTGRIRLLAISAPDRRTDADIPTFVEQGVDLVFSNWRGIVAPPGITPAQKAWIMGMIDNLHASPEWRKILQRNQWQDEYLQGDAFGDFLREDSARTRRVLDRLGIGVGDPQNAVVGAAFFPNLIGVGLVLSIVMMIVTSLRRRALATRGAGLAVHQDGEGQPRLNLFAASAGLLLAYILATQFLGFIYATPVFIVLMSRINGSRAWLRDGIVAIGLTAAITVTFTQFLHVAIQ